MKELVQVADALKNLPAPNAYGGPWQAEHKPLLDAITQHDAALQQLIAGHNGAAGLSSELCLVATAVLVVIAVAFAWLWWQQRKLEKQLAALKADLRVVGVVPET